MFVVNALLDLPGDEAEFLAEIRTQITQLGRLLNQLDPDMIVRIVDHFESSPTPPRRLQLKHRINPENS